ncbi:MAG TPA: hypothetical protein VIF84_04030 [Candidatus Limnocylindrales bacterium]
MTTFERFEGDLPMLLDQLATSRPPDYLDEVFERTARARQRPRWTFPERWLPLSVTTRPAATHLPVRALALLVLALLAIALAGIVLVGSMRPDLPTPFGVAGNGQVAYTSSNDIVLVDPVTGSSSQLTTSLELESAPTFSPDGTGLAFRRLESGRTIDSYDIVVVDADGSHARTVASLPIAYWSGFDSYQWTPDSRSLLVNVQASGELRLYNAAAASEPRILARGVTNVEFRPPKGDQILFRRLDMSGTGLYTMNVDGSDIRPLIVIKLGETLGEEDLGSARWSPDGSKIVFTRTPPGLADQQHIYVMDADGSDIQPLPIGAGTDYASRMTWSPDGTRIAFERWDGDEERLTIGVLTLATGIVIDVGPQLGAEGVVFDWSPDGTTIIAVPGDDPQLIAIDPSEGSWEPMGSDLSFEQGVLNDFRPSWQRLKP